MAIDRLLACLPVPTVLVSAPAGYGKTVVLAQLRDALLGRGSTVGWLTVGPHHADEAVFEAALHAAATLADRNPQDNAAPPPPVPAGCVDVLIVDAIDALPLAAGAGALERLVAATTRAFTVVLASNRRLPFPVSALMVQRRCITLDAAALRCDAGEAAALISLARWSAANRISAGELVRYTEGWIAGLVMLVRSDAVAAQGRLLKVLPLEMAAYLADVAFHGLEERVREQLLAASIVDQLTPSLFERLTGTNGLHELQDGNSYLSAVPDAPIWRRFHRLYLRFLRERASGMGRNALASLHRRAAEWHLEQGSLTEAAQHAIESADEAFLVATVSRAARAFIGNGQVADALAWLEQLGPECLERNPLIAAYYVTALMLSGRTAEAEAENKRLHAIARTALEEPHPPGWASIVEEQAAFQRELIRFWRRDDDLLGRSLDAIRALSSDAAPWVGGEASWLEGLVFAHRGDLGKAQEAFAAAMPALTRSRSWYALVSSHVSAAAIERLAGPVEPPLRRCRRALAEIVEAAEPFIPALAMLRLTIGEIELDRSGTHIGIDDLDDIEEALARLRSFEWDARYQLIRARLARMAGDVQRARDALERAAALAAESGIPTLIERVRARSCDLLLALDDTAGARRLIGKGTAAGRVTDARRSEAARAQFIHAGANARVLLAEGHLVEGTRRLVELLSHAQRLEARPDVIEVQLSLAGAWFGRDDRARGCRFLREALLLAQACDLRGAMRDARDPRIVHALDEMLARERADPVPDATFRLDFLEDVAGRSAPPRAIAQLPGRRAAADELTSKEAEVMELVAAGYSNQQIASELFISLGTVKWHVRNILGKLDAPNRTTAIRRFREPLPYAGR